MAVAQIDAVPARRGTARVERAESCTVVWIGGEHDISTVTELTDTVIRAIALDDVDVVLDLSTLDFMDATTVSVIVRARGLLAPRSLRLRSPSASTRRTLEICGLSELIHPHPLRISV